MHMKQLLSEMVDSKPSHHQNSTADLFVNPWPPLLTPSQSAWAMLRVPFVRAPAPEEIRGAMAAEPVRTVKPVFLRDGEDEDDSTDAAGPRSGYDSHELRATWLGHAGFLVELPREGERPARIIFDPIFAQSPSPSKWVGPGRHLQPPCKVEELPEIDFVAISHNHYDHLDIDCLVLIHKLRGSAVQYLVPLGIKTLLVSTGLPSEQIHELDWWETRDLDGTLFVCTPAMHNSGRGVLDQRTTLWCGWIARRLESRPGWADSSVYFAGDTGYQTADGPCPVFQEIGELYGSFDLALIPIWRGASLSFLGPLGLRLADDSLLATLHAFPEDAIPIQRDVRARHALGMHFGTFAGSLDEAVEPLARLERAAGGALDWRKEGGVGVVNVGETAVLPLEKPESDDD